MIVSGNDCIRISVVICTYRRPGMLRMAIKSLLNQTLAAEEYEIIVIDNNSRNGTRDIVYNYIEAGSNKVRYVLEKQQGLSHARNTGVRVARGNVIAFLDDDAVADAKWLASLLEAYDSIPDAWAVGGKVLPIWDAECPEWLSDGLLPHLSLLDWGDRMLRLKEPQHLAGVNCSFRQEVFKAIGFFPTDLGRIGMSLLAGEEAELTRRIYRLSKGVYYLPQAVVYHHVTKERLIKQYFRRRLYWSGWSQAICDRRTNGMLFVLKQTVCITPLLALKCTLALRCLGRRDCTAQMFQFEGEFWRKLGYVLGLTSALRHG